MYVLVPLVFRRFNIQNSTYICTIIASWILSFEIAKNCQLLSALYKWRIQTPSGVSSSDFLVSIVLQSRTNTNAHMHVCSPLESLKDIFIAVKKDYT
jgi:hypothetical protein